MSGLIKVDKKRVVVGMSGGVDSSVCAYLLKEQGYDVIGVTMQIWQDEGAVVQEHEGGCCGLSAVEDARRVAEVLDIPYYVMNFRDIFQEKVIDYFTDEYLHGRTPNPCIACNHFVKWQALLQRSLEIGADYIATGHYAKILQLPNGRYAIRNSVTAEKDQTYALYGLTQDQLAHTLLPVGEYTKPEIRKIAEEAKLPVAHKHDSQEICFVPDGDYASFIEKETGRKMPEGNFVTVDGQVLGRHRGITHYTIGQRRGLDLPMGRRVFVTEIRPETNEVVVGEGRDVFADELKADHLTFMAIPDLPLGEEGHFLTKIRYNHRGTGCTVKRTGEDEITCRFDEPVRAVTPGQAVVFYQDDCIAGGGIIC
ncbi:MAG: tRNA 2-thiouridine(34) synthase MnmA [Eubacterium sp.]|nr:tRNA 2-thiouridine(34) synthase MnmA [Eubacterium sp.]